MSVESNGLRILVTGASGFVGQALVPALIEAGHTVRAMTRNTAKYEGAAEPVAGDITVPESLKAPLDGIDVAYYLVHSLDSDDFESKDADGAKAFGAAAAEAGVRQIIYLGGLGDSETDLSPHLRSRREVELLLTESKVPVTVLRAAVVVGKGGISWEMTRRLVERLPVMAVPSWATTRSQPIALRDVVRYLVGVAGDERAFDRTFEIGGSDQLTYVEMMQIAGRVIHGRPVPILRVPIWSVPVVTSTIHFMSARWIKMITGVNQTVARHLIESLHTEVVVSDNSIREIVPGEPLSYLEAVREASGDKVSRATVEAQTASSSPTRRAWPGKSPRRP